MLTRFIGRQSFRLDLPDADFYIRLPLMEDFESWRSCRLRNTDHLQPFEPTWSATAHSRTSFRNHVRRAQNELLIDRGASLFLIEKDGGEVIGGINLRNIRRSSAQMGTLGYWMSSEYGGAGRMKRAVGRLVHFGFEDYNLHRIEAACVPENKASAAILLGNGFEEEGFAKAYLRINGSWRDHRLFAILRPDDMPMQDVSTFRF